MHFSPNAAYYIAFGPHGPRAAPPPGEQKKVFAYTAAGVLLSFVIFATMRSFAKPPPSTMTKEWQEATNEFLKVRLSAALCGETDQLTHLNQTGPEVRPHYRSHLRGLQRQGPRPVSLCQRINFPYFHLCLGVEGPSPVLSDIGHVKRVWEDWGKGQWWWHWNALLGRLTLGLVCKYCTADNALSFPTAGSFGLLSGIHGALQLWGKQRDDGNSWICFKGMLQDMEVDELLE